MIYTLFLQNGLMICEEAMRIPGKDEWSAPELSDVTYRLQSKAIQHKSDSFFWETGLVQNSKTCYQKWEVKLNRIFSICLLKLQLIWKLALISQVQITSMFENHFSLGKRDFIYGGAQCASQCLMMTEVLDMDSLLDENIDAKNQSDEQLVDQNQPVDTQWMNDLESRKLILMGLKTCNCQ